MLKAFHEGRLWSGCLAPRLKGFDWRWRSKIGGNACTAYWLGWSFKLVGPKLDSHFFLFHVVNFWVSPLCEFREVEGHNSEKKIVPFKPTAPPPVLGSAEKIGNSSGPSIFQQSAKAKGKIFPLKAVSSDTIESQPTSNGFSGLRRVKQTATIGLDFRRHWAPARGDGGGILRAPGFWGQPRTASFLRLVGLCMRLYECPKIQWHFNNNHAKDFQHPAIWRYHDWF